MKNDKKNEKKFVVCVQEMKIEVVRAYEIEGELRELAEGRKIVNAYKCPDCEELHENPESAADCCDEWSPIKVKR